MSEDKKDLKSRIIRYLTKADIVLTSEEEKRLDRWTKIDHLLRAGIEYADIMLKVTNDCGISRYTFNNDYSATQEVFSRSRMMNKQYLVHLQLEMIDQDIRKYRRMIYQYQDEETKEIIQLVPDPKEIAALAKLNDARTKLINMLPEENDIPDVPRPVTMYQLPGGETMDLPMAIEQALRLADKMIMGNPIEDIDHEDLSNEADEPIG